MKLTKYEHSCVVLEKDGKSLVIDPGELSRSFQVPENCVGVVITHEHFDHLDQQKLHDVFARNPEALLLTNKGVAEGLDDNLKSRVSIVAPDDVRQVDGFSLEFVGGIHERAREEIEPCKNTGVIVDGVFYHPGDAHCVPEKAIQILAIPLNAPWSKVSETNDFVKAVKAKTVIPIHDGLLTEAGISTYEAHIKAACEMVGSAYQTLKVGDQTDF